MSDEQDVAEALDEDELGDNPSVPDQLPGENFPPDHPMGSRAMEFAADGSIAEDDVATREWREEPEDAEITAPAGIDLVSDTELDGIDDEEELIADAAGEPAGDDMAAEIAAMHIVTDEGA